MNTAINNLFGKENLPKITAATYSKELPSNLKEIEAEVPETYEPEGVEETMLSPLPPKPVDIRINGSHIKNPG